jgi:hypothetical protein
MPKYAKLNQKVRDQTLTGGVCGMLSADSLTIQRSQVLPRRVQRGRPE